MDEQTIKLHPVGTNFFLLIEKKFGLSPREIEILKVLLLLGLSNREISIKLKTAEKTIQNHIYNIYKKTNTNNARELQALIFREMLITCF
ncbi:LuxR C-terminal-related transcriptional regulator [Neobacillus pocheonensis]|uniref:helix-turn-helix transcriptional regulator n=1 Tax=Neobacillus pocheonensis TaxID=363869 RepID=UPI003D2BB4B8